jgi:hypothetical protein
MINVSVEVREGATLFRVAVKAVSINRAVSIMKGYHPGRDVQVVFPIDPEEFFVEGPKIRADESRQSLPGSLTKA